MSEIEDFNLENSIGLEIKRRKEEEDAAVWIMLQEEESDIRLEKRGLKSMAWRQRYEWLEEGKLADILARLEIGACIVDNHMEVVVECETTEVDMLEEKVMEDHQEMDEDEHLNSLPEDVPWRRSPLLEGAR